MKRSVRHILSIAATASCIAAGCLATAPEASAQFSFGRALQGIQKAIQASQISDDDLAAYIHQTVQEMDRKNKVAPPDSPYTIRLVRLTSGITEVEGIPLNFKAYITDDINAFACADGSVRVYSGLMDVMTDNEVLGVIGHEIGHVAHHDSRNALKKALRTSAFKDVLASTSDKVASLTDSQLGAIGEALINTRYSREQESQADDYGYDFLVAHGKNPWAMAEAFEKLSDIESRGGAGSESSMARLFSDHPDTRQRIAGIAERCRRDGYQRGSESIVPDRTLPAGNRGARSNERKQPADNHGFILTPSKLPEGARRTPARQ